MPLKKCSLLSVVLKYIEPTDAVPVEDKKGIVSCEPQYSFPIEAEDEALPVIELILRLVM